MKRHELIQSANHQQKDVFFRLHFSPKESLLWRGPGAFIPVSSRFSSKFSSLLSSGFSTYQDVSSRSSSRSPKVIIPVSSYAHLVSQPGSSRFHPNSSQPLNNQNHPGFILMNLDQNYENHPTESSQSEDKKFTTRT